VQGRANEVQRVPLVTKVKQMLGIQGRGKQRAARRPVDTAGRPRGGGQSRNTPRIRERREKPVVQPSYDQSRTCRVPSYLYTPYAVE
jgi:hypothetical protein